MPLSENVVQRVDETNLLPSVEAKSLEASLKVLWDRTRRVGELLAQMREERVALQKKVEILEREVTRLTEDVLQKDELLKKLKAEPPRQPGNDGVLVPDGERQQLGIKVRELLAKIEGYL